MAQQATIEATPRTRAGKGAARSLRREGKIPAVIYGRGRNPEPLVVDTLALTRLLSQVAAATTLVDVAVEGRAPATGRGTAPTTLDPSAVVGGPGIPGAAPHGSSPRRGKDHAMDRLTPKDHAEAVALFRSEIVGALTNR